MTIETFKKAETLTSGEINKNKIKAIYPHITVSGSIDKPYYNIDWYDIKKQTMYRGFSSYKLPLVYKWLQEEFEVVEADIDDIINRQKAEIERLAKGCGIITEEDENWYPSPLKTPEEIKAEAVKEFAERLKTEAKLRNHTNYGANKQAVSYNEGVIETRKFMFVCIDNLVKEMAGEG